MLNPFREWHRRRNPAKAGDRARDRADWVEAMSHYAAALGKDPSLAHIWVQYGHALKEGARDLRAAEAAYRRSLAIAPEMPDSYVQLGHCLKLQGRSDEAAAAYFQALSHPPLRADARTELAGLGVGRDQIYRWIANHLVASELPVDANGIFFDITAVADPFRHNGRITPAEADALRAVAIWAGAGDLKLVEFAPDIRCWRTVAVDDTSAVPQVIEGSVIRSLPVGAAVVALGPLRRRLEGYFPAVHKIVAENGRFVPLLSDVVPLLDPHALNSPEEAALRWWLAHTKIYARRLLLGVPGGEDVLAQVSARAGGCPITPLPLPFGIEDPGPATAEPTHAVLFAASDLWDIDTAVEVWTHRMPALQIVTFQPQSAQKTVVLQEAITNPRVKNVAFSGFLAI